MLFLETCTKCNVFGSYAHTFTDDKSLLSQQAFTVS